MNIDKNFIESLFNNQLFLDRLDEYINGKKTKIVNDDEAIEKLQILANSLTDKKNTYMKNDDGRITNFVSEIIKDDLPYLISYIDFEHKNKIFKLEIKNAYDDKGGFCSVKVVLDFEPLYFGIENGKYIYEKEFNIKGDDKNRKGAITRVLTNIRDFNLNPEKSLLSKK